MQSVCPYRGVFRVILSVLVVAQLVFSFQVEAFPLTPEHDITPGEMCTRSDEDYAEDRYAEEIPYCRRNVSYEQRVEVYETYGISEDCRIHYTVDHLIPLSIGGNNEFANLWPEAKVLKEIRQDLEFDTFLDLRDGKIDQRAAVRRVLHEKRNPPDSAQELKIGHGCDTRLPVIQLQ